MKILAVDDQKIVLDLIRSQVDCQVLELTNWILLQAPMLPEKSIENINMK